MEPDSLHIEAEELSAYADGDLGESRRAEVDRHFAGCEACRSALEGMRALRSDMLELGEVEPRRDLFPAIERALAAPERPRGFWKRFWMIPAAAVVGAAAALLLVFLLANPNGHRPTGPASALDAVIAAEVKYREAIGALEQALGETKPSWNPKTERAVQQGLAEVDRAIEKCRLALQADPKNLQAHETMLAAYQCKVDFLTQLVGESL